MADGAAISLPMQSVSDSGILGLQLARVQVNSGDTTAVQFDLRLDSDDSGAAVDLFVIPDGTYVWDVGWFIHTAFTAANIFTIGDSDAAAGWATSDHTNSTVADTDIAWARKQVIADSNMGDSAAYGGADFAGGKLFVGLSDAGNVELTIDAGASPAAGQMDVYAMFFQGFGRPRDLGAHDTAILGG